MRGSTGNGKRVWPAVVAAAAVLLLSAPPALASRTASTRTDLLASPALQPITATPALAPTYAPQGFALRLDADAHPATFALFDDLAPAPEHVEPEKLASGVERWALTPNLQRIQLFVAESWQVREFLGPIDSPNLYQAFGLDPMNNTDPYGLCVWGDWECWGWVAKDFAKSMVTDKDAQSTALGFVPVVGDIKDWQEVATGKDLITGEKLALWERGVTVVGAVVPVIPGKGLRKLVRGVDDLRHGPSPRSGVPSGSAVNSPTASLAPNAPPPGAVPHTGGSPGPGAPANLDLQRTLAVRTSEVRDAFLADPDSLLRHLQPGEIDAIIEEPWRMRLFFGTAVERRVAKLAESDSLLSSLTHTKNNAPQDFLTDSGFGFDITGGSSSSIRRHATRPGVDAVVTYESIPDEFGSQWVRWYLAGQ